MKILGISAFYHDSAAALLIDGEVIAAAQEERFTRKKHDSSFPVNAITFCLDKEGLKIDELDAVVFYDKPLLKFERLLETYYGFAPKGLVSFVTAIPVWIKEKLFLKKIIHDSLNSVQPYNKSTLKLLFPEHHLSHAASAFFPSSFKEAAIITIDGVGEWATASVCKGENNCITNIKELHFPHSVGLLYSAFTYFLGFKVNSGEYKLMGLAPYGIPNSPQVKEYIHLIRNEIVHIYVDGSIWLNQSYFRYSTGLRMINLARWEKLFSLKKRKPNDPLQQHHANLALAVQEVTEDILVNIAREAKRLTGSEFLCMAGGVALNCVANGKLLQSGLFKEIFIQPAAGDAGGSLGAALAAYHIYFEKARNITSQNDKMNGSYLGPEYSDKEIEQYVKSYKALFQKINDYNALCEKVADLIANGMVVGWFQGCMEFGPRALGNRSILGDARNEEMQKKLNLKIKYRESFRPFAPSVLEEDLQNYFDLDKISPYMLLVAQLNKKHLEKIPQDYYQLSILDRLYVKRSNVPAVTHIDFSARIQSVHQETNKRYHSLINAFKKKTGLGLIVNTSFNVRGEPIVCSPKDAYQCFMRTEMDYLVMGNYLFDKAMQPKLDNNDLWKEEFELD